MKVLVIGGGGREHALAWKLSRTPGVTVYGSPGNPGIAQIGTCVPARGGKPADYVAIAESLHVDLTVVGPEGPLVDGVVDAFRAARMPVVGPTRNAAQLEGSKVFAKDFLAQRGIPTARYITVDDRTAALRELDRFSYPVVLKADGLAAGKGVIIAQDRAQAEAALPHLKGRIVIEEFLSGEEVSFIVLSDGKNVVPLAPTQDHKAVFDGDTGPNTGGMGAYCDGRILTERENRYIMDHVIHPTIEATGFTGFLYAGMMMTAEGPKVLEFNVRLGDPETQPLMHRLDCDLAPVLEAAARGELADTELAWKSGPSVCVVLASAGYPAAYQTGRRISGVLQAEAAGAEVFHAGTRLGFDGLETSGGRVLGVTASGADLPDALHRVYAAIRHIQFEGMHYRTDIGRKGLQRYNVNVEGT